MIVSPLQVGGRRWLAHGAGCVSACLGLALTLQLLAWMNHARPATKGEEEARATSLVIAPRPTPKKKPRPPERRAARPKVRSSLRPPTLASDLAGSSFGLALSGGDAVADLTSSLLGDAGRGPLVMNADAVDAGPKPLSVPAPEHPAAARARGISGYVKVSLLVNERGQVSKSKIIEAQPPGVFDAAVLQQVATWRFAPATYKGEPVRIWQPYVLRFQLDRTGGL